MFPVFAEGMVGLAWRLRFAGLLAGALVLALLAATPTGAETVQQDGVRLSFRGDLAPDRLPRARAAPVRISLRAGIAASAGHRCRSSASFRSD